MTHFAHACAAGLLLSAIAGSSAPAANAGAVTGVIDAVRYEGDQYYVFGWAKGPVATPQAHICAPVSYLDFAGGINIHEPSHLFVATLWNQGSGGFGPEGVYFTTSTDFIHWSKPALAMTLNQMLRREPPGDWSYMYFSLIDPRASDLNYATITDHPYLYYVRLDGNHGPYQRVLFRQKIKLDWLIKQAEAAAHPPQRH